MSLQGVDIVYSGAMIALAATLLLFARGIFARLASYNVDSQLVVADNPAVGTSLFGFMAGVIIALAGIFATDQHEAVSRTLGWDVFETTFFGVVAILLLRLAGVINDRLILHNCENTKEIVKDRNVGVGALLCGSYVASGLVLAGAFSGRLPVLAKGLPKWTTLGIELGVAVAVFLVAQIVLVLYGQLYQRMSKHNPLVAIEKDYEVDGIRYGGNTAAGIAMGGNLAAVGVLLWGACRGDIYNWGHYALRFGLITGVGLVLLILWRLMVIKIFFGKLEINREIYVDRNPNVALLETAALIGFAIAVALVLGTQADLAGLGGPQ